MRAGVLYSVAAYLLWSLFPLYFTFLARSGALEIIGYRVLCSLVFCLLIMAVVGVGGTSGDSSRRVEQHWRWLRRACW